MTTFFRTYELLSAKEKRPEGIKNFLFAFDNTHALTRGSGDGSLRCLPDKALQERRRVASVVGAMYENGRRAAKDTENEMSYTSMEMLHASETDRALRLDKGRRHLVDEDPRRICPCYICPGGS